MPKFPAPSAGLPPHHGRVAAFVADLADSD